MVVVDGRDAEQVDDLAADALLRQRLGCVVGDPGHLGDSDQRDIGPFPDGPRLANGQHVRLLRNWAGDSV